MIRSIATLDLEQPSSLPTPLPKPLPKPIPKPILVGICGGSCSGKTTVAQKIYEMLCPHSRVAIVSQDNFYRCLPEGVDPHNYDFDDPHALDLEALYDCLQQLHVGHGLPVSIPQYDFVTHSRMDAVQWIPQSEFVIVEGIHVFYLPKIRDLFDLRIFVKADGDTMLYRRLLRDEQERGRQVKDILDQYTRYVKPSYEKFVKPMECHATIIIPNNQNNRLFTGTELVGRYLLGEFLYPLPRAI